jgi:hypothetical protein
MNNYLNNMQPNLFDPYQGLVHGNMFPNTYSPYKIQPYLLQPTSDQAKMMLLVQMYGFAAHDLNLYLDVHPDDKVMMNLFNQYKNAAKTTTNEYENKYGPISISSEALNTYPWAWVSEPWPWDK